MFYFKKPKNFSFLLFLILFIVPTAGIKKPIKIELTHITAINMKVFLLKYKFSFFPYMYF